MSTAKGANSKRSFNGVVTLAVHLNPTSVSWPTDGGNLSVEGQCDGFPPFVSGNPTLSGTLTNSDTEVQISSSPTFASVSSTTANFRVTFASISWQNVQLQVYKTSQPTVNCEISITPPSPVITKPKPMKQLA
jgi:hypothetical protein